MTKSEGQSRNGRRQSTKAPIRVKTQRATTQGLLTRARKSVGQLGTGNGNPAAGALGALTGRDMGSASRARGVSRPVATGGTMPHDPSRIGASPAPVQAVDKATDLCDACGKTVRLKKDGALYAHKCVV